MNTEQMKYVQASSFTKYLLSNVCDSCSVMPDSATPWTIACQAPLFMEFSRQDYWSGLPFPSPKYLLKRELFVTCKISDLGGMYENIFPSNLNIDWLI